MMYFESKPQLTIRACHALQLQLARYASTSAERARRINNAGRARKGWFYVRVPGGWSLLSERAA